MPSLDPKKRNIVIGSRQSDLARIQAIFVSEKMKKKSSDLKISFFNRPSYGDLNLDMDLKETNSKGVFTQEFKQLLKDKRCDLVVHSWKDLPIENDPDTLIFTLPEREDQRDLLFLKKKSLGLTTLKFLTSSPRREYQLQASLKDLLPFKCESLTFKPIRGNIPTRFSKFLESKADGFVVAKAAVDRLMGTKDQDCADEFKLIRSQVLDVFASCKFMVLPLSQFPTAAAQGALALEILKTNPFLPDVKSISSSVQANLVEKERQTHKKYGGGCHQAMGFSALGLPQGDLFYSQGTFENKSFQTKEFYPSKVLNQSFSFDEVFSQAELHSVRSKSIFLAADFSDGLEITEKSEVVVSRYEAKLDDLKSSEALVWASGLKTWAKLAHEGFWVNGTLDGLGIDHKPDFNFLGSKKYIWLSNSSAPENGIKPFVLKATYDLKYEVDKDFAAQNFENKKCFYWMSGHGFESALKVYPKLKSKIHFCGLGRTVETLQKYLTPEQIYFCLNEEDFIEQCT